MFTRPKVLAITKRTGDLCATQAMLYGAGFELFAATSLLGARSAIRSLNVEGVILCRGSWTDAEKASILADLKSRNAELGFLVHCPGCTGCDEASGRAGTLVDCAPVRHFIAAIDKPTQT